jgi:two-component system, NtrC family, response regulator PilR
MMKQQPLVLLVDDEPDLCMLMQMTLSRMGIKTHMAHHLKQALQFFSEYQYDACITDFNLPDGNGIELVKYVNQHYPKTPIAVLTAYANMELAISALKAGAFDFVSKPINQQHLHQLLKKALHVPAVDADLNQLPIEEQYLIGVSEHIQQLRLAIKKIARSQAPVFITGESGTGKEIVANLIHQLSNRHDHAFIAINCGAMTEDLMESELFGHIKGSFPGADQDKQGLIQAADGGTLFLDEIVELSLAMQAKLLRAVQEKKIRPIGSDKEVNVDFRIVSASHQNLENLVQQGKFRQDLFFRIHVMDLTLAPLRERPKDISVLARHFVEKISSEWRITAPQLSNEALDFLKKHPFQGNVRELKNMIERALTLCDESTIQLEHIQSSSLRPQTQTKVQQAQIDQQENSDLDIEKIKGLPKEGLEQYLENVEKEVLINALNSTHWNRTLAAKKLGMTFRSLRYRLKKFGLDTDED